MVDIISHSWKLCILFCAVALSGGTSLLATTKTVNVTVQGGATGEAKLGVGFGHLTAPAHVLTLNLLAPTDHKIQTSKVTGTGLGLWRFVGDPEQDVKLSNEPAPAHTYEIIEVKGNFEDEGHSVLFEGTLSTDSDSGAGAGEAVKFEVGVADIDLLIGVDDQLANDTEHSEDNSAHELVGLVMDAEKKQVTVKVHSPAKGTIKVSAINGVTLSETENGNYAAALPDRAFGGGEDTRTFWVQSQVDLTGTITAAFEPTNASGSTNSAIDKLTVNPIGYVAEEVKVTLNWIKFSGDDYHDMKKKGQGSFDFDGMTFKENGTVTIDKHWKSDGLRDPACFTRGATPKISYEVTVTNPLDVAIDFRILPYRSDGTTPKYQGGVLSVPANETVTHTFSDRLRLNPLSDEVRGGTESINWRYGINVTFDPEIPLPLGLADTSHAFFQVLGVPNGSSPSAKRIFWAVWSAGTRNLGGATNPGTTMKSTDIPRNLQKAVGVDTGTVLGGGGPPNGWAILDNKNKSTCADHAILMRLSLRIIGVAEDKTEVTNVTSNPVNVEQWLGENRDYTVYRAFHEATSGPWINEGVCGVDVEDEEERLYYDAGGTWYYGPKQGPTDGSPAGEDATFDGRVDNPWLEPDNPEEGNHGPIMWRWSWPFGGYVNGLIHGASFTYLEQVRVVTPNGGTIEQGSTFPFKFYTAGLKGQVVEIGRVREVDGTTAYFHELTIPDAGGGEAEFNKQIELSLGTGTLEVGKKYKFTVRVKGTTHGMFQDSSNNWFEIVSP